MTTGFRMRRILVIFVLAAAALTALVLAVDRGRVFEVPPASAQGPAGAGAPARGTPVETANARAATATNDIRAVGTLQSDESVKIAPEVAGRIAEIAFKEGEPVAAGAVLVKLDDALVRAEIDEAQARYDLAKANFDRAQALARTGNVTERARDEAVANFETARATLELAKVRLAKHALTAPFAGVVGLRKVSAGAFIAIGTEVVNLEKIDSLKVDFKIPEVFLGDVAVGQTIDVTVDALGGRIFTGAIYAIDPQVDVNGRALQIRARLPNPDGALRPGLFARITIKGRTPQNVVMVPESAIVPRGGENYVYRVQDGKAMETKVSLGERKAGQVEVRQGLDPEVTVITAGHQRLRDGAPVDVVATNARSPG
jgi:membrane fusion protein (multidrug efflux system)